MSSTYTGLASNIGAASPVTLTIPSDGDALSAASVDVALQKLADYVAFQATQFSLLSHQFIGNPGNTASTSYQAWAAASQAAVATNPTTPSEGQCLYYPGFAGKIRGLAVVTGQLTAGGTVTVSINFIHPGGGTTGPGISVAIPSGTASLTAFTSSSTGSFLATDSIAVQISNGAGVSASIGLSRIAVLISTS